MSTVKSSSENLTLNADGVGSDVIIQNNGTEAVRVDSSGNVGIGTTSPASPLDVVGGVLNITNSSAGDTDAIELSNYTGDSSVIKSKRGLVLSADYDNNSGASQSNISFQTDGTEQANITNNGVFQFNSGYGSVATAYGVRAWVNFNGTGTVAIRSSGNVSSITDLGTGNYRANFTNSMPDSEYVALPYSDGDFRTAQPSPSGFYLPYVEFTVRVESGTYYDGAQCGIAIIR